MNADQPLALPPGAAAGRVFDDGGHLVGLSRRAEDNSVRLVPLSMLRVHFGEVLGPAPNEPRAARIPVDLLYEQALPITLQLVVTSD